MGLRNYDDDCDELRVPLATELGGGLEAAKRKQEMIERCPSDAWFLGPKAEQGELWESFLTYVFRDYVHWRRNYYPGDPVTITRRCKSRQEDWVDELHSSLDRVLGELKAHFPFYSPRYIGHMLSEQTLPSVLGYFAGMLYNPNNVTSESAPVTVALELEVGRMISEMMGYDPKVAWAHLCSGGTVANLEAFWVARIVQFAPLIARELCREQGWEFTIEAPPRGGGVPVTQLITEVDDRELLLLPSTESIPIFRRLASWATNEQGMAEEWVLKRINKVFETSPYSVSSRGYANVAAKVGLRPVILVSEAAHYSVVKAAEVLGYGKDSVRLLPVERNFRVTESALAQAIDALADDEYLAVVVMVAGTTEEGSIDPVHQAVALRKRYWAEKGISFWLHVDAAWGGYITCLFRSLADSELSPVSDFVRKVWQPVLDDQPLGPKVCLSWDDQEVHASFQAIGESDSVTVDPHKLGYIPYPAGLVAFSNGLVTELIQQKAQYISDEHGGVHGIEQPVDITAIGPFTLEGSRPGSVASSVWLSHKMIPLYREGHGKIMRDSLLAAQMLAYYIEHHAEWHDRVAESLELPLDHPPCTFSLLYHPDTNVICFLAFPAARVGGKVVRTDICLKDLNELNQKVYSRLSLRHQPAYRGMSRVYSYSQPFFVSRTWITPAQYRLSSVQEILDDFGLDHDDYLRQGLFVLRSTVMNPLLLQAASLGKDYVLEFLSYLQATTGEILQS